MEIISGPYAPESLEAQQYISSDAGLYTLRFDLTPELLDLTAGHGGSAPIVGHDGTVYAVGSDHLLRAYAR